MHFTVASISSYIMLLSKHERYLNSHGGFHNFCNAYHRETTKYDETKKRDHDLQMVRAKENIKVSHGGPSKRQASDESFTSWQSGRHLCRRSHLNIRPF